MSGKVWIFLTLNFSSSSWGDWRFSGICHLSVFWKNAATRILINQRLDWLFAFPVRHKKGTFLWSFKVWIVKASNSQDSRINTANSSFGVWIFETQGAEIWDWRGQKISWLVLPVPQSKVSKTWLQKWPAESVWIMFPKSFSKSRHVKSARAWKWNVVSHILGSGRESWMAVRAENSVMDLTDLSWFALSRFPPPLAKRRLALILGFPDITYTTPALWWPQSVKRRRRRRGFGKKKRWCHVEMALMISNCHLVLWKDPPGGNGINVLNQYSDVEQAWFWCFCPLMCVWGYLAQGWEL